MKKLILMAVVAWSSIAFVKAQERVDVVSSKNFKKTVEALEKSIKSKGMMIVATVDHQNMLKMVGTKIGGATTIEFGKPDMGKMLFSMKPEAGLEMPAKIYVYVRTDGKTVMSFYKTNYAKYGADFAEMDGMMKGYFGLKFGIGLLIVSLLAHIALGIVLGLLAEKYVFHKGNIFQLTKSLLK